MKRRTFGPTHVKSNRRHENEIHFLTDVLIEILNPACVLIPTSAEQVSTAVRAIKAVNGSFAAKGGSHTAIAGANSIDGDVLIAFSNMTHMRLSDDLGYVHIGPGLRWGEVYNYLEPFDLTVAGGRVAPVGVPGLLLAGGIGFYGNKYGFSANTVTSYEVVLADGSIVNASASNDYRDLFWAVSNPLRSQDQGYV